ncbi:MAG: DUF4982 domain-containing protein [Bacteroidetes bacterium]|nr:DUF4982 domain-containing protein [Bacteroidota bacterium]
MKKKYLLIIGLMLLSGLHAQVRRTIDFNNDWKFYLGNDSNAVNENYNDVSWRTLNLPHDWSIEGNFSKDNPATNQGGALPGGIGWYRKTFTLPASSKNKLTFIEFDGVYRNSEVWINGHYLGKRPNGYISFQYNLTPYLKFGTEKNVIAVKVDNAQQPNSRWYSGSGIYRNVRLAITNKIFFQKNGLYIIPETTGAEATLNIQTTIQAPEKSNALFTIKYELFDATGKPIKDASYHTLMIYNLQGNETQHFFTYSFKNPVLWSVDKPYLYTLKASLLVDGIKTDEVVTKLGIRQIHFDREKGFFLNNQPLKIKGVCLHHDLGALGAAFNVAAAKRQLQILKDMGCNAIRTSHNPPAPEFLDLCDQMGFLVMDEAFDMWQKKKNKFDYALDFKAWHKQDLQDMIKRDRNHPCIFMWSIGNEIREQFDSTGIALTKELVATVKQLDATRPVTSALTETDTTKNFIYRADALDVTGWNYNQQYFPDFLKRYPGKIFIASETTSALATRGHYDFPSDSVRAWPPKGKKEIENVNGDWTVSAYDHVKAGWGSTHEETWAIIKKYAFLSGMFVWTGFDYLGEPTPYPWPARSSYFGIVDLAGFPKDVYYMYQSEWSNKPVLHVFPHWNWKVGDTVDVWTYYNHADKVELFVNGTSFGSKTKNDSVLHVQWRVPYVPGELKVVSTMHGKKVMEKIIRTAGAPYAIKLSSGRTTIKADGKDMAFITATIVDQKGIPVPYANNELQFSVTGNATLAATDNGYEADTTAFTSPQRRAWKGLALGIVRPAAKKGNSTLTVSAPGLIPGTIALKIAE